MIVFSGGFEGETDLGALMGKESIYEGLGEDKGAVRRMNPPAVFRSACGTIANLPGGDVESPKTKMASKQNLTDLMRDPFFARLMLRIETKIHSLDSQVKKESGVLLTDSNVKSSIIKAVALLSGKKPKLESGDAKDRIIGELATELAGMSAELEKGQVARKDYTLALLAVEDSLKTRHDHYNQPRGYLDFLGTFIREGNIY